MGTSLSVNIAHAWDTMTKGVDNQGAYYQVGYYVSDWSLADQVANELLGYSQRVGSTTVRTGPHQHPLSPNLCCQDVQIEGVGAPVLNSSGLPVYSAGFMARCTYRAPAFTPYQEQDPGNQHQIDPTAAPILWCTQELEFDTETIVHDQHKYVWEIVGADPNGLNGKTTEIPVTVKLGVTTMTLTYHQLPYLPMSSVRSLRNKVNNATFLGVAAGKLLFLGGKSTREQNTQGDIVQRVTLVFKERDEDWRAFLRKDLVLWAKIKDSSGNYVLSAADFTPLANL